MNSNHRDIQNGVNNRPVLRLLIAIFSVSILQFCSPAQDIGERNSSNNQQKALKLEDVQVTPVGYQYPNKETFKVLSWNVEHFVDNFDDPYIDAARENKPDAEMSEKVAYLAEALKLEDADIVIFQEFESTKFLRKIAQDHLAGMGYEFFASAPSDGWYMNVVVMSKFPLGILYSYGNVTTPVVDYKDENGLAETQNTLNTRMWSLEVFPAKDYNFLLTGLHLKAGRGERNEAMRLGQINFLKHQFSRFLKMDASQNLLVAGDLNSVLESKEIEVLKSGNSKGEIFYDPLPENVLTHPSDNPSRRLDYVLFNGNMKNEYIPGSAKIPNFFDDKKMKVLSDHLPIIIRFKKRDD